MLVIIIPVLIFCVRTYFVTPYFRTSLRTITVIIHFIRTNIFSKYIVTIILLGQIMLRQILLEKILLEQIWPENVLLK
jgi:hypothetical protein